MKQKSTEDTEMGIDREKKQVEGENKENLEMETVKEEVDADLAVYDQAQARNKIKKMCEKQVENQN